MKLLHQLLEHCALEKLIIGNAKVVSSQEDTCVFLEPGQICKSEDRIFE